MRVSAATTLLRAIVHKKSTSREKIIANLICNLADTDILAQKWGHIAETAPMALSNLFRQLYTAARCSMPSAITLPTLLLCSTNDRLVNVACSHSIADTWNIQPIAHETAGHDLTTDDPQWCISQITSWLQKVLP